MSGCAAVKGNSIPCSQTSSGGPFQRTVLVSSSKLILILRRGFDEVYVTQIELFAQVPLGEHRVRWLSVITGTGSMQRSSFAVGLGNDEKQVTLSVRGVSPVQHAFG